MIGVVLMNMGGPATLDEVEPFLRNLLADPDLVQLPLGSLWQGAFSRLVARRRAPKVQELYRLIGGGSPLGDLTRRQASALEVSLRGMGVACRCYVAMRYSHPSSADAVAALRRDGIQRVIALSLYPQYSVATTGSSLKALAAALDEAGGDIEWSAVDRYSDDRGYLDALAASVGEALTRFDAAGPGQVPVLFSAHGLPKRYIQRGDPYEREIRATVAGVVARLGLHGRWHLGYQSRVGPQRWLGPATEAVIRNLGAGGARSLLCVPVAFVSDHLETLQEIDILYRDVAREAGITSFQRAPALNTRPDFIAALAHLVRRHLGASRRQQADVPTSAREAAP